MAVATTVRPWLSRYFFSSATSFSPPVAQAVAQLPQPIMAIFLASPSMAINSSMGFFFVTIMLFFSFTVPHCADRTGSILQDYNTIPQKCKQSREKFSRFLVLFYVVF